MLSFLLNIQVKKDQIEHAKKTLAVIEKQTQSHNGVINFMWFQHVEESEKFTLLEQWENQELLDYHIEKIINIWNEFIPYLDGEPVSIKINKL